MEQVSGTGIIFEMHTKQRLDKQANYFNCRANRLDKTIKNTSPLSFKGFPVKKAFVYG